MHFFLCKILCLLVQKQFLKPIYFHLQKVCTIQWLDIFFTSVPQTYFLILLEPRIDERGVEVQSEFVVSTYHNIFILSMNQYSKTNINDFFINLVISIGRCGQVCGECGGCYINCGLLLQWRKVAHWNRGTCNWLHQHHHCH